MADCAFCINKEIRAREIVGDALVWALPTNIPITPGHALIVPRRHVAMLSGLTNEERLALLGLAEAIGMSLMKVFRATGFNYAWNQGELAGQSVPHFHLHVVPRTEGDAGILEYEPRQFLYRPGSRAASPEEELRAVAKEIKKGLS